MPVPLTIAARIVVCCATALALVGCSAGQITQTDSQVAAVDGTSGDVGNTIALRDAQIPYPRDPSGTYPAGSAVPVQLAIINQGNSADELLAVTSPTVGQAQVFGIAAIPAGSTVISTDGFAVSTSPLVAGQVSIVLTTTRPLRAGLNTPLTFQFRNAGTVTIPVPIAPPPATAH